MAKKKNSDSNRPLCAYCGKKPGTEDEHAIARGFFPAPRPARNEYIIVPACEDCNRGFVDGSNRRINMDEEYARGLFIMEFHAGKHPAARRLLENEVARSIRKNPAVGNLTVGRMRKSGVSVRDDGGLIYPNISTTPVDWERIERVLRKIVRGLYYHETGSRFPDTHEIFIRTLSMLPIQEKDLLRDEAVSRLVRETQAEGPRRIGAGVFSYALRQIGLPEDPARMVMVLAFYDGVFFAISAHPLGEQVTPPSRVIREGR